ncbi:Lrp/AsnC family transcriptional regulator [Agromyces marinus]|uniref:AsnC family transcriptional regulator n=1 Tax=Agromyces marinus TaxID=1389020 RepID=A0ABM8H4L5_9MICO|nr:Lrp/AsnC family transcriptional regulator [Agromyces marinus]UIP59255.1 Leucine-responsive regulatory protein [Agromyces marinus]BDZ55730.1 AsnC family transcriptional regulator [Agromyces marinus]
MIDLPQFSEPARIALDEIDRQLIGLLHENARIPNVDLARRVGVSPSTCLARVRSLRERGIITRYTAEINHAALGYSLQALVSVRIRPGARHLMEQISDDLRREPEVAQLFFLGGSEDFLIHVRVRDSEHVRQFVLKNLSANPAVALTETNLVFEHHTAGSAGVRTVV